MTVLGIESSCDETSAAIVRDGTIVSLVIASQHEIHAEHGGVVPELAARAHTERILPVVTATLAKARLRPADIDAVAATYGPGLSGSLAVGFTFAKALAHGLGVALVAVDHIEAHAFAARLTPEGAALPYPWLVLLVSGGHTLVAIAREPGPLEVIGSTVDDACGEAYDKVGSFLGLGYPAGPALDRLAATGDPEAFAFPLPRLNHADERFDFSFSGLKSAVVHQRDRFYTAGRAAGAADVAASFQHAAISQLFDRLRNAVRETGISTVVAGGGVAANSELRRRLEAERAAGTLSAVVVPPTELCVDNGAMVAGLGEVLFRAGARADLAAGISARVRAFRGGR